jgi:hypothetical protein
MMAWQDKNLEAKYISPSGGEHIFLWDEKLSRETDLKTGVFTFPDKNGAHVQHQGAGATTFPIKCIFNGADCLDQADSFESSLIEEGIGELQHPIYGTFKVIPTGNIKREDDFVSGLNESYVTVTFTETITDEAPTELAAVTAAEIDDQYSNFAESAASDFSEDLTVESAAEAIQLQFDLETQALIMDNNLSPIAAMDAVTLANYKTTSGELKESIAELKNSRFSQAQNIYNNAKKTFEETEKFVLKALNTARLSLHLMKMPSRMAINLMEKTKGYTKLATDIINQFKNDPYGVNNTKNAFISTSLVLSGCMASIATGSALSIAAAASSSLGTARQSVSPGSRPPTGAPGGTNTIDGGVVSREETIETMNQLVGMFESIKDFQDSKIKGNAVIDSNSNSYLLLNQLVYSSIQLILKTAFSLPMQRTIILDRDRQVIELCCELYGSIDYLDKFITENNFNIDEIELLPMGKEVTYYVPGA